MEELLQGRFLRHKNMEITAYSKSVRVSTRKIRLVADVIRRQPVAQALKYLSVIEKRGAYPLEKTLRSAIANAVNNNNLPADSLFIKTLDINEATPMKRFHASTRGRIHPYKKRGTHIRFILESKEKPAQAELSKKEESAPLVKALKVKGDRNGK
jgi:large subunit ribosomal protein L22